MRSCVMVKRASHSVQIPGVSLQEFCELFAQPELFIDFHHTHHRNERVTCGVWSVCADGSWQRDVSFLMPLEAPAWLKKAVGEPGKLPLLTKACQRDGVEAHTSRVDGGSSYTGWLSLTLAAAGTEVVFVRDHHDVRFGPAARRGKRGVPADASKLADSALAADRCASLDSARAAALAQLASGELQEFQMLTRPALAPPWGARYHIADMRFMFAHSAAPQPSGFTVRPCKVLELRKCESGSVQRQFIVKPCVIPSRAPMQQVHALQVEAICNLAWRRNAAWQSYADSLSCRAS